MSLVQIAELTGQSRTELSTLNPGYSGDFIDVASPGRILIPSDVNLSVDQKVSALKGNGSASLWVNTSPAPVVIKPMPTNTTKPVVISTQKKVTPKDANDLAKFATNADVPSAPRIPVAVTTATDLKKPINVEPPISSNERDRIVAQIQADDAKQTVTSIVQPIANKDEQQQVISEIKAIAPVGTEVVDPYDGKIKLTAIQTSQSIADSEGKEITKSFTSDDSKGKVNANSDEFKENRSTYTVIAGDTLATIAAKNGVSWRDIAKWNQIDPNASLYVGNILYLYNVKSLVKTVNTPAKPDIYTVKANDSLTAIASQYGVSTKDLADWNSLQVNSNVVVGQKLYLKAQKDIETNSKNIKNKSPKTLSYIVKRRESLKVIAERYDISEQALADLTPSLTVSSSLKAGQKINVPQDTSNMDQNNKAHDLARLKTELYKVQRKENFAMIADKFDLSVAELAKINHVKASHVVKVGDIIKVPKVEQPEEYVVQRGDTLASIAASFNFQPSYLARLNRLSTKSTVHVGQKLTLIEADQPAVTSSKSAVTKSVQSIKKEKSTSTRATESYTIKSGDSFNSIAKHYDLTIKELAEINNISVKSMLKPGQEIDVPKKMISYKVKTGDNWTRLGVKYDLEPKDLAKINGTSTAKPLKIGAVIQVPNK